MQNRFLEMDAYLKTCKSGNQRKKGRKFASAVNGNNRYAVSKSFSWSRAFAADTRALVILIENGGIDIGVAEIVDKIFSAIPGSSLIPDSYKTNMIKYLDEKIKSFTDNLLETVELSANRYTSSKPDLFGDVFILRNDSGTYEDLKSTLIKLTNENKIIDLMLLTHGNEKYIYVKGVIDDTKIAQIRTEAGKPLTIRSVYMMNCFGSSLNKVWLDTGAKASAGSIRINYMPEPTTYFFWSNWKEGQNFETAVTNAYRKTVNVMNEAVRTILKTIPGVGAFADSFSFDSFEFVQDSAPVIEGQRSVTINSDDLNFAQSMSSSMATTVLPVRILKSMSRSRSFSDETNQKKSLSQQGIDLIKRFEGFKANLYNDPVGHCTVGYGTLLHKGNCNGDVSEQPYINGVNEEQATQLLLNEAKDFELAINDNVTVTLNQCQFDALVSFTYNVGAGNFKKSTLLKLLNQGNYAAVPSELKKWTKARQNGQLIDLPGLVNRRKAEADVFENGVYPVAQSLSRAYFNRVSRTFSGVSYDVPGIISPLKQPSGMVCWCTVTTMMMEWKKSQSMSIETAMSSIGGKYLNKFKNNQGLSSGEKETFLKDAGFEFKYPQSLAPDGWENLMRTYGPIWVTTDEDPSKDFAIHARIMSGIQGDGTAENTYLTITDPGTGTQYKEKFADFLVKYEQEAIDSGASWSGRIQIVHWPSTDLFNTQQSISSKNRYRYVNPSRVMSTQTRYARSFNPAAGIIAGIEVADAAQVGLGAIAVVQSQVSASQGSFTLSYDKAQRMLTNEARTLMPGAQTSKQSFSKTLMYVGAGKLNAAEATVIIEWEGNAYGEIGTAVIRRDLANSTEWSKSSANFTITKVDRIPLPQTDPRTWPLVYTYEGTYDPWANGYFEFSGEFEINAFGGLKFNRHEVYSRAFLDFAITGTPDQYVQKGQDISPAVPEIPQEQLSYLKTKLP